MNYTLPKRSRLCSTWKDKKPLKSCVAIICIFVLWTVRWQTALALGLPSVWETCAKCQQLSKCHKSAFHYLLGKLRGLFWHPMLSVLFWVFFSIWSHTNKILVKSSCTHEGYKCITLAFAVQEGLLFGLYFIRSRSQGVATPVSESETSRRVYSLIATFRV